MASRSSLLTTLLVVAAVGCAGAPTPSASPSTSTRSGAVQGTTSAIGRPPSSTTGPASVTVDGRPVPSAGLTTIADALIAAGARPTDGRLLSLVTGRVLDAHAAPATILVGGRPVTPSTPVRAGDTITTANGADRQETEEHVTVATSLAPAAAALYEHVEAGSADVVRGQVSGEVASSTMVTPSTIGKLRAPAQVALTFDDGPSSSFTAQVLELLAAHRATATFCLVGVNATARPALAAAEAQAGMGLCDHTEHHWLDLPTREPSAISDEITAGAAAIGRATGALPTYFRAPGGNWSAEIEEGARAAQLIPLRWTVDPRDWSRPGTATIVQRVLDGLRPNGIVLLHDGGGDRSQTVAALAVLLDQLQAAGWAFTLPGWVS